MDSIQKGKKKKILAQIREHPFTRGVYPRSGLGAKKKGKEKEKEVGRVQTPHRSSADAGYTERKKKIYKMNLSLSVLSKMH